MGHSLLTLGRTRSYTPTVVQGREVDGTSLSF